MPIRKHPAFRTSARSCSGATKGTAISASIGTRRDGLPTWGDGRLTILGTEGYIELRKYVDIAGRPGTDHLFIVNGDWVEHVDCASDARPYYSQLVNDVRDRTETAMRQSHCFKVMELALKAQASAVRLGHLR